MRSKLQLLGAILLFGLIFNGSVQSSTIEVTANITLASGDVTGTTYWGDGHTYWIKNDIIIEDGANLQISQGIIVKFSPGVVITVYGRIAASGVSGNEIYFTSMNDNTQGETITGSSGAPSPGDWGGIEINGEGDETSYGYFNYCDFKYSGNDGDTRATLFYNFAKETNCSVENSNFSSCEIGTHFDVPIYSLYSHTITCYNNNIDVLAEGYAINITDGIVKNFSLNKVTINGIVSNSALIRLSSVDIWNNEIWANNSKIVCSTTINTSSSLTISGSQRLQISSTGYIGGAGDFNFNGVELILQSLYGISQFTSTGNIRNSGTRILSPTAKYTLLEKAPAESQITGDGFPEVVGGLEISNSEGVTLSGNIVVSDELIMTDGNITTGSSNSLILGASTSSVGTLTRTSGTIIGNFTRWFAASTISDVLFPIGTASNYRPVTIDWTSAPSVGGTLTASFAALDPGDTGLAVNVQTGVDKDGNPVYASITNASSDGYWTMTNSGIGTNGQYSIEMTADGFAGISDYTELYLLKRVDGESDWFSRGTHVTTTGSNVTPVLKRTALSQFSDFGVGSSTENALPVELTTFEASVNNSNVQLSWETATEVNNYGFNIERKPENGEWNKVGFVDGHGNSNSPKLYSYVDKVVTEGLFNYRLKQIDIDGSFEYSEIIEVNISGIPKEFSLSQNYPNPFNPSTKISYQLPNAGYVSLIVYDVLGNEVATLVNENQNSGDYDISFNGSNLTSGIYFYKISTDNFSQAHKMILMK